MAEKIVKITHGHHEVPTPAVSVEGNCMDHLNISVSGISKGNYQKENPYGTGVMRGFGAATKGKKISGKMG